MFMHLKVSHVHIHAHLTDNSGMSRKQKRRKMQNEEDEREIKRVKKRGGVVRGLQRAGWTEKDRSSRFQKHVK